MQIKYLGTGASEGIPGLFCECAVCAAARERGGRNVRRRCSLLIDGQMLIDLSPDFGSQLVTFGVKPSHLRYMLISHAHDEHFVPAELQNLVPPYRLSESPARVGLYAGKRALHRFEHVINTQQRDALREYIDIFELKHFIPTEAGPYTITPLPARHCEGAMIFLIERDGKTFLNGTDSGYFPEETWDWLSGKTIHAVSLDCNNPASAETPNHMSVEDVVTTRRRLFQLGCVSSSVRVYITHISHSGGMGHDELQELLSPRGITVAYDGLTLEI